MSLDFLELSSAVTPGCELVFRGREGRVVDDWILVFLGWLWFRDGEFL